MESRSASLLTDYSMLPRDQRNLLRLMFVDGKGRQRNEDWDSIARFLVGAFRADVARVGAEGSAEAGKLVSELCDRSSEFAALWDDKMSSPSGRA